MKTTMQWLSCATAILLPACFASSGLDDDPCGPNPCTAGAGVESCEGRGVCEELSWCGATIFCDYEDPIPPPPPPPPPGCTEPRPMCADSTEVTSCEGWDSCFPFEWCGETYYCASNATCNSIPPTCPPGEEFRTVPCAPEEVGCTNVMYCGETFSCHASPDCFDPVFEPCFDATSTVLEIGTGECPDFDSDQPCYDATYCGELFYCVTACPQGGQQVEGPWECRNPNDCYSRDNGGTFPTWCQGNGPICRAIPTCGDEGIEIPLGAPCTDDGYCEYRNVCSTTIQCQFNGVVVG